MRDERCKVNLSQVGLLLQPILSKPVYVPLPDTTRNPGSESSLLDGLVSRKPSNKPYIPTVL